MGTSRLLNAHGASPSHLTDWKLEPYRKEKKANGDGNKMIED